MNLEGTSQQSFFVKSCALAAMATGERAASLLEMRDKLATINEGCIYYHFWGGRMRPQFGYTEYHNDFARWAHYRMHDNTLAERLNVIDPTEYPSLEALRQEVLETVERCLDDSEVILWTKKEDQFHFIRSTTIVFETPMQIAKPEELLLAIPMLPPSSIFYHLIDARGRTPDHMDDFSYWLQMFGEEYKGLIEKIQTIDPYFLSLTQLKDELISVLQNYFTLKG